jgi:hypothetical protein
MCGPVRHSRNLAWTIGSGLRRSTNHDPGPGRGNAHPAMRASSVPSRCRCFGMACRPASGSALSARWMRGSARGERGVRNRAQGSGKSARTTRPPSDGQCARQEMDRCLGPGPPDRRHCTRAFGRARGYPCGQASRTSSPRRWSSAIRSSVDTVASRRLVRLGRSPGTSPVTRICERLPCRSR